MSDILEPLILDLLEWIGTGSRPYAEVMDAWRTSCPRLPVWEDANERGFIESHHESGLGRLVCVSASGRAFLLEHRSPVPSARAKALAETAPRQTAS